MFKLLALLLALTIVSSRGHGNGRGWGQHLMGRRYRGHGGGRSLQDIIGMLLWGKKGRQGNQAEKFSK